MAVIQLGDGKEYRQSRVIIGGRIGYPSEAPSALILRSTTPKDK
jgi:hypothetical protein